MELYQVEIKLNGTNMWIDIGLTKSEHKDPHKHIVDKLSKKYRWDKLELIQFIYVGPEIKI